MNQSAQSPVVVVTGANGLVGARVCASLSQRGAGIRAVVRRSGAAPTAPGISEWVGDFADSAFAAGVLSGADAAITTVHPMASDLDEQRRIGVEGTTTFVKAAVDAGVPLHVHISTAAVYNRRPGVGDVDESSDLVGDDAGVYPVTKRDLDAALGSIDGITRVLIRPPAILGPGDSSVWNTLRPAAIRDSEPAQHAVPQQTFSWVHVNDLAAFAADVATGELTTRPVTGACTPVNVAGEPATVRDYYETVTRALKIDPVWDDSPAWTGQVLTDLARSWGWRPAVNLADALDELGAGLER